MEGASVLDRIGNKRGRDDEGKIGRLEKRPSGVVIPEEYSGDEMINGVKYEEEKEIGSGSGSGSENNLITNLVNSPKSKHEVGYNVFEAELEKNGDSGHRGGGDEGGGGGGIINNLIANIFSSNGGGGSGEVEEKVDGGGDVGEVVGKDGGSGGESEKDGGVNTIDDIVAQLPRTLSEDTTPTTTDEASILIHSIIHD